MATAGQLKRAFLLCLRLSSAIALVFVPFLLRLLASLKMVRIRKVRGALAEVPICESVAPCLTAIANRSVSSLSVM